MTSPLKVLLITPPLVQPNTPYSATALLTACLRQAGFATEQMDMSLELLLRLFSPSGLEELYDALLAQDSGEAASFIMQASRYQDKITTLLHFLQGRDPDLALRFCRRAELPEGPRLEAAWDSPETLREAFGVMGHDLGRHLASLCLDDIADAAQAADPWFGFSRYAEELAIQLPQFKPMYQEVASRNTIFTRWMDELTDNAVAEHNPNLVAMTVPFPGTLFGALRIGHRLKQNHPGIHVAMGGGYCNTELGEMSETSVFDFVDSICLDSTPLAIERLAEFLQGGDQDRLVKTMMRDGEEVVHHDSDDPPLSHNSLPAPTYAGLNLDRYFGLIETLNPVTRLWSAGRWNRLMLAHGCHWGRCAFCDTELECISRYDPADAETACNWMESLMEETGHTGFHFVDEALSSDLIDKLCDEILARGVQCSWWGNIRFEKNFTKELIEKMAATGCIAVAGGLETVCDRTLKLMRKGINLSEAQRVMDDFAAAGILIHAYLMYDFPTQTEEETRAAEERVESMFEDGILHSAHWHRFALTAHSDINRNPARYSIRPRDGAKQTFARNELAYS